MRLLKLTQRKAVKKAKAIKIKKISKKSKPKNQFENNIGNEILEIKNFKHLPGKNCQLSSLRKVLINHDLKLSENMLLGLASGIGFLYWNIKMMPFAFVGGLNGKDISVFENVMKRIGGSVKVLKTGSLKTSYEQLKAHLRKGKPLIPFVDMAYLPYFFPDNAPYPNEEAGHFGGHTIVVYAIDEKKNVVHVSDRFNRPNALTIHQFMDAHSSNFPPFAAKNRKLQFTFPEKIPDLAPLIFEAIKENYEVMMNPPIKNFGLKGMLKFKAMVMNWPKDYKPENLLFGLISTWIYNQTGGSGGAMFRNIYSDFLSEASEIIKNGKIKKVEDIYREAAAAWDEVALCILPDELPTLKKIREIFYKNNKIQEEASPDYQKQMRDLDEDWKKNKSSAIEEVKNYGDYVPALQDAIQKAHDLEEKAWKILGEL
ncbi:MAG: DUF4872 domain-containing protein [Candidatus Lokiarchaeota archaeon]|nr:DUF4872 domain-containing protein [Candidatus Lokiarchaeota archaeon]